MAHCSVAGCEKTVLARGWCPMHLWRWRHYGSPDYVTVYELTLEERFWRKVSKASDPRECWMWTAALRGDGYGGFQVGTKQVGAHRYSYELHHGPIPAGMVVMHSCDEPRCVNPAHLSLGTNAENAADSARKARRPRGSLNSQAKLTEDQVLEIRDLYARGAGSQRKLAEAFGISRALVSVIVTRKAWKHI